MAKTKSSASPPRKSASPDPMAAYSPKVLATRLGLFLLAIWVVAVLITRPWAFIVAGVITLVACGAAAWVVNFTRKSKAVASLVQSADTPEARRQAIAKLDADYKKGDAAAVFAKSQLLLQEDPRKALEALEQIDLSRVLAPIADETRAQRAMIHLILGESDRARVLVDGIDISRHQQPKTRASLVTVMAEAWARTGQSKKALETLKVYDPEDAEYTDLKAQLYRAYAFAYAGVNDMKGVRRSLSKMLAINPQLLGGFLQKKVHPLLEQEARQLLVRSGNIPRETRVRRM